MTLDLLLELSGQAVPAVHPFFPVQVPVGEVGTEAQAGWVEPWVSWEAREDQEVASLDEDHLLAHPPTLDLTTSWVLGGCQALEVVVEEGAAVEEVDFPLGALHSSTCLRTLVHPCIQDQGSIPCFPLEVWEVPEEVGLHTPDLVCLRSSMAREDTPSTVRHYLVLEVPGGLLMAP